MSTEWRSEKLLERPQSHSSMFLRAPGRSLVAFMSRITHSCNFLLLACSESNFPSEYSPKEMQERGKFGGVEVLPNFLHDVPSSPGGIKRYVLLVFFEVMDYQPAIAEQCPVCKMDVTLPRVHSPPPTSRMLSFALPPIDFDWRTVLSRRLDGLREWLGVSPAPAQRRTEMSG